MIVMMMMMMMMMMVMVKESELKPRFAGCRSCCR
jgi:hypothetical protein